MKTPQPPKVAIVHDWLNNKNGGAERVLFELAALYPDAPVFTLVYDEKRFGGLIDPARIRTSFLQRLPRLLRQQPNLFLPLIPSAIDRFDLKGFDIVISSSGAWSKNIKHPLRTLHVSYCHSPARFLWDFHRRYLDEIQVRTLNKLLIKTGGRLIRRFTRRARVWDYLGTEGVDRLIANSNTVAARIKTFYHRDATVITPPVDTGSAKPLKKKGDYFVTISALTPYKNLDIVIEAFNRTGQKLIIIGDGSERKRLRKLAGANIEFAGFVSDRKKWQLLAGARAFVFANEGEDFGIAAVEAMAAGTPVIVYAGGGLKETVVSGITGSFFTKPTADSLYNALQKFDPQDFDAQTIAAHARQFDAEHFRQNLRDFIESAYAEHLQNLFEKPVRILGVPIHAVTVPDTLAFIERAVDGKTCRQISTVNTEFVMRGVKDASYGRVLEESELNVADGIGLCWAAYYQNLRRKTFWRWIGSIARIIFSPGTIRQALPERITGIDLVYSIAETAARHQWSLYLLGGWEGAAFETGEILQQLYPGLKIAGTEEGSPLPEHDAETLRRINDSGADILFVAFGGGAKQELWIERNRPRLKTVRVAMGVGGSYDFITGRIRRAPRFIQHIGLEWLWRLMLEPTRIKRQLTIPQLMFRVYKSSR